jgi:hypothetical protein
LPCSHCRITVVARLPQGLCLPPRVASLYSWWVRGYLLPRQEHQIRYLLRAEVNEVSHSTAQNQYWTMDLLVRLPTACSNQTLRGDAPLWKMPDSNPLRIRILVFAVWWCNHIFRLQPIKPRTFVRIRTGIHTYPNELRTIMRTNSFVVYTYTIVSRQAYDVGVWTLVYRLRVI